MPATVARGNALCPNKSEIVPERRGRKTDPLVRGFEGSIEGLAAVQEDRRIIDLHVTNITRALIVVQRSVVALKDRVCRLDDVVIPELKDVCGLLDASLQQKRSFLEGPSC